MHHVLLDVRRLVVEDEGQDLVEYGLLAALIAVVAAGAVGTVGKTIYTVFWEIIARGF
jgi:Flp pilus assembly pilin Flp